MIRTAFIIVVVLFSTWKINAQHVFAINDFAASSKDLSLRGAAKIANDRLRITPASPDLQGAAWYKVSKIDMNAGFETEFTFLISETGNRAGDGFAFIMQNASTDALGGTSDNIGYKQIPFVMAIEFDTKDDDEGSRNHVNLSFYNAESKTYRRYATVHEIPEITDGKAHFTKVIYQNGNLQVFLDSYIFPVLSVRIDIAAHIKSTDGLAWVGFTASTSEAMANHDLLQWSVKEYLSEPEIEEEKITVVNTEAVQVEDRKIRIKVWDHNTIDGDIISLKWGDEWILTNHTLTAEEHEIEVTLHGFEQQLILFANNVGQVPPNTVMLTVFDGQQLRKVKLNADFETSEAVTVQYRGSE